MEERFALYKMHGKLVSRPQYQIGEAPERERVGKTSKMTDGAEVITVAFIDPDFYNKLVEDFSYNPTDWMSASEMKSFLKNVNKEIEALSAGCKSIKAVI